MYRVPTESSRRDGSEGYRHTYAPALDVPRKRIRSIPSKKTRFVDCFQNWKINQMNRERVEVLEKLYQQIVMEAQETQFTLAPRLD